MTDQLPGVLPAAPEATLAALHDRLAADAAAEGILDVAYTVHDSALGPLLLAATDAGVVRLAFEQQGHDDALDQLARLVSPRILRDSRRLDPARREVDEYLAGQRRTFDVPLDLRLARGFRRAVLDHLPAIPYGRTESYSEVAHATGNPRAVRAVGTACATNPVPLLLPCHRVIRSDGTISQYAGGAKAKAELLALEAEHRA